MYTCVLILPSVLPFPFPKSRMQIYLLYSGITSITNSCLPSCWLHMRANWGESVRASWMLCQRNEFTDLILLMRWLTKRKKFTTRRWRSKWQTLKMNADDQHWCLSRFLNFFPHLGQAVEILSLWVHNFLADSKFFPQWSHLWTGSENQNSQTGRIHSCYYTNRAVSKLLVSD